MFLLLWHPAATGTPPPTVSIAIMGAATITGPRARGAALEPVVGMSDVQLRGPRATDPELIG